MANVKNFGLVGVGSSVQYGKAGPSLTANSSTVLQAAGTAAFMVPNGTAAQRPSGLAAMLRFNDDTDIMEFHNGTTWVSIATGGTAVTSVTGTTDRITSTGGLTPVIDIAATYVGQTSLTTLGTVTTGTWNGTTIAVANGGTGATTLTGYVKGNGTSPFTASATVPTSDLSGTINLATQVSGVLPAANGGTGVANSNTITLGGNVVTAGALSTVGAFATEFTMTGATNVTFPTSGTLLSTANIAANAVTSFQTSLSGLTPSTATNGVVTLAGTLGPTSGGTGLASFSSGDVLYASAGNTWAAAAPGVTSGVQAYDAGLTALAAKSDTGILVQTAADTYSSVSLVQPAAGITITNASGVAGSPTFALANDLAAVEGLTGSGYAVRTAADTWTTRTINGTAGNIVVGNGDGVSTNTDINLATVTNSGTGTFVKLNTDSFGRVTGTTAVVQGDITALVDAVYVNLSGDTMTGSLVMSGGSTHVVLPNAPVGDTDAANKAYVDSVAAGLAWKDPAQAATTAGVYGVYNNGAAGVGATITVGGTALTIDGVVLANGNRLLVKNQVAGGIGGLDTLVGGSAYTNGSYSAVPLTGGTGSGATADITVAGGAVTVVTLVNRGTGYTDNDTLSALAANIGGTGSGFSTDVNTVTSSAQNGIYVVSGIGSSVVLTRGTNIDAPGEFYGAAVLVTNGTVNDNTGWTQTEVVTTVGTSPVLWIQFSGANTYTWGTGLEQTGNTINVNLGAGISELPSDEVGIHLYDTPTGALWLTENGTSKSTATGAALYLKLDTGSGLAQTATGLKIDAASVTNAMLVNPFINVNADSGTVNPVNLGETFLLAGTVAQGISTSVADNTITITAADASSSQKGVATFQATEFVVTAGNVTLGLVGPTKGGTGFASYTVGDILYADTTTSLAKRAVGAAGTVLKGGTTPTYGAVSLTADVAGILPSANGGTGVNNGASTLTLGGNLTTSGAFASTFTMTGATSVTFPTSGTLATVANTVASFSGGTTGLTPASATTGAITLAGTLVVANGGTGVATLLDTGVMIGNGTSAVETSTALTFDSATDILTIGGATGLSITAAGGGATISTLDTNANLSLVPNGTGSVIIGPAGAGLIQSDAGQALTVRGNTQLSLESVTGDTLMVLPGSNAYKVAISGPSAAQYIDGLADNDLATKYYVDQIAGSATGDIKAVKATVSLAANASTNIGAALPAGATILSVKVNVTVVNTTATLVVGKSGGSQYMTAAENDPQTVGLYLAETYVTEAGAEQVQATVAGQTGGVGSCTVIVTYQIA